MGGDMQIQNLLEPSLKKDAAPAALLSERASFLVSFFGGPIAALLAGGFNVRALNRIRNDAWVVVLAIVTSVAVVLMAANATLEADTRAASDVASGAAAEGSGGKGGTKPAMRKKTEDVLLFGHELSRSMLRRVVQASGLVVFLGFFLRHRRFHRALALADAPPARPWVVGLACVGAGWLLQLSLTLAYVGFRR